MFDRWVAAGEPVKAIMESKPVPASAWPSRTVRSPGPSRCRPRWPTRRSSRHCCAARTHRRWCTAADDYKYVATLGYFTPRALPGATVVDAKAVAQLLQAGATYVDTRTDAEFKAGHVPGAVLVPYHEKSAKDADFDAALDKFEVARLGPPQAAPLIFACNGPECWKSFKASHAAREGRLHPGALVPRRLPGVAQLRPEGRRGRRAIKCRQGGPEMNRPHEIRAAAACWPAAPPRWPLPASAAPPTRRPRPRPPRRPGLPAYVAWKKPEHLIVHTGTTIETQAQRFRHQHDHARGRLTSATTCRAPDVAIVADRDAWELAVEGVQQPAHADRGRTQDAWAWRPSRWCCSAPATAAATSPTSPAAPMAGGRRRLRDLERRAGAQRGRGARRLADGARFITGTGGEKLPDGLDPKIVIVERSVPLQALEDAMLAWEMNGEPMPHAHGGPLRLIVPGYSGVNNIKYVKRLAFTREQTDAASRGPATA